MRIMKRLSWRGRCLLTGSTIACWSTADVFGTFDAPVGVRNVREGDVSIEMDQSGRLAVEDEAYQQELVSRPGRLPLRAVAAWALALWLVLIPIRGHAMGYGWYWLSSPQKHAWMVIAGSYLDLLYVMGLATACLALLWACQRRWVRALIGGCYVLMSVLSLLWAMVNVPIVKMLGQPLNWPWLYNSGFLNGLDAFEAVLAAVSAEVFCFAGAALATFGALGLFISWALKRLSARPRWRRYLKWCGLATVGCYLPLAWWTVGDFYSPMLRNPVVAFADSLLNRNRPLIFSMATDVGHDDFLPVGQRQDPPLPPVTTERGAVKNVLLIVLESVAAQYLPVYGSPYAVTPELDQWRRHTRIFASIYANAPNTNKTMFSLLCSRYPTPSYLLETQEHADARISSLSAILSQRGYRTGMFYAADLRFGNAEGFLENRKFDAVNDYRTMGDGKPTCPSAEPMPFLDATDDQQLGEATLAWIRSTAEEGRPFFAIMWTGQTHYPYFNMEPAQPFEGVGEMQNRYLNAIRESDAVIGKILRELQEMGMLDSTLVVLVGDHGQAFGQHGQYGHGSRIYEENVRVPLLMIQPRLFSGEMDQTVGSMVDVAPTILHILGLDLPADWQGRSLLAGNRSQRTYFLAPWSGAWFGYREGSRKYIYLAEEDRCEVYDLASDAEEKNDLAPTLLPEELEQAKKRMAAWVQYQEAMFEQME